MAGESKQSITMYSPTYVTIPLGIYVLVLTLFLVYVMINAWPEVIQVESTHNLPATQEELNATHGELKQLTTIQGTKWKSSITLFGGTFTVHDEARLVIIALLGGGIGASIHAIQSFIQFVGHRTFITSWVWWYIMRAPIGALLALVFYFALRAGLLGGGGEVQVAEQVSVAGIASLSTLVGLFTEQAVKKLSDVFDAMFTPKEKEEEEGDGLHGKLPSVPEIIELQPMVIDAGTTERMLVVKGKNFVKGSEVRVDESARKTQYRSLNELSVELSDADVQAAGTRIVTVVNASGIKSNTAVLRIEQL